MNVPTIACSMPELEALQPSWTALRNAHGLLTPNADPCLYAATVEALNARPDVTLLRDGDRPVAIIVGRRSIRPLGWRLGHLAVRSPRRRCLDIVYGGLITDGSPQAIHAVADHLQRRIRARELDHVMINHLRLDHELFAPLSRSPRGFHGPISRHWRFALGPTPEQTLTRFSRKHRYNMRRADRLLVERFGGDVELQAVTEPEQVPRFVEDALAITAAGYQGAIGAGFGNATVQRVILDRAARDGRLRGYRLMAAGRAIAYQAGVTLGNVFHLRSTAFLPRYRALSPGQVLLVRVIEDLAAAGIDAVDYGFGDARYKQIYGTESHDEATVYLYSRTLTGRSARLIHRAAGEATTLVARSRLGGRIRKRLRERIAA